jgi:hypothetical protein
MMEQTDASDQTLDSSQSSTPAQDATEKKKGVHPQMRKGWRFWAILGVLGIISLLTSLEATVTSTVLPSVVADLSGGEDYIWLSNAYFLAM